MLSFQVVPIDVFYYYIYEIIMNWYTYVMTPASIDGYTQCLLQPAGCLILYICAFIFLYCCILYRDY